MIHLSVPTQSTSYKKISNKVIDVKALILYPFFVAADALGNSCDVKEADVRAIHAEHNKNVKSIWNRFVKMGRVVPITEIEAIPNQKDHKQDIDHTVGHVIGEFELVEGEGGPYLFANLRVKGDENVEKVEDKRWSKVSLGFDKKTYKCLEISWVVNGAIPHAENISFSADPLNIMITNNKMFNQENLIKLQTNLLSKQQKNFEKLQEKETELEIENMLISLSINGKLLPRDKLRVRTELSRIGEKTSRLAAFRLLENNLINVIDYDVRARNNIARDWQEDFKMTADGKLDMENVATRAVALFKKGKLEKKESPEENKEEKGRIEKKEKKEEKESMKFKKKDKKHLMSLAESGDMEEMGKYLSAFLSEEEIDEDEKHAEKKEEKEKAKFSAEIVSLKEDIAQFKAQNSEIAAQLAILSKGNEDSKALFAKILELSNT